MNKYTKRGFAAFLLTSTLLIPQVFAENYTVKSGDSVYGISKKYNVSMDDLKKENKLTSNLIHPGQILSIPNGKPSVSGTTQTYTVKVGDTLWKISQAHKVSVDNIKKWNKLTSDSIFVGQKLNLSTSTVTEPEKPTTNPTPTKTGTVKVNGSLNVRSGAGTTYSIVGSLSNGVKVEVLKEQSGWAQIKAGTTQGWVSATYITYGNTTTPVTPPTTTTKTYTVKSGDYLYLIATMFNTTVDNIKSWNNLTSNVIYTGQVLSVSGPSNGNDSSITSKYAYHTVKNGETFSSIATKYNLTTAQLQSLNGSSSISVGKILQVSNSKFIRPTIGLFTSGFGGRWGTHHDGIDISTSGTASIQAAYDGVVSRSYFSTSYGEVVFILHNVDGVQYETVYAHMRSGSRTVKEGDVVKQGQHLGYMGATGNAQGQHLHFEMHKGRWNATKSVQ